ncbi:MAG TPA: hypothetical protein VN203_16650 [Candidatus Acidoferrum sp.]|nr:hypothetical protein [Candidatus Acidoferrum sp.]
MTYVKSGRIPIIWRLPEGLPKRQFIAQTLALAVREQVKGAYIVLFSGDDVYSYQWGLTEDIEYDAVVKLAREHKSLTID